MIAPNGATVLPPGLHQRGDRVGRHRPAGAYRRDSHALRMVIQPDEWIGRQAAVRLTRRPAKLDIGAGLFQVQERVARAVGDFRHAQAAVLMANAVAIECPFRTASADVDAAARVDGVVLVLAAPASRARWRSRRTGER